MDENKIHEILKAYTKEQQTIKAIEELGELQVELARILNNQGNVSNMFTELADVFIMITQIIVLYDVDTEQLDKEIAFKLDRQIKRIRGED